jgi:DNA-binding NarL/FixJ family response regulator
VSISASDPVSKAGVAGQLRHRPEVELLDDEDAHRAVVAIVAADEVDDDTVRMIRGHQQGGCSRVVLVATSLDDHAVLAAVEAGVRGLVRRSEATPERLVAAGCTTNEIARRLAFSERTVKNAIHDVTSRLQLRNRSHAVAYAVRQGLI